MVGQALLRMIAMEQLEWGFAAAGERLGSTLKTDGQVVIYSQGTGWGCWMENY